MDGVPEEFWEALLLLMPDAVVGHSAGETAFFPCYDAAALQFGNRLFRLDPGTMPRLGFELEVRIPAGTLCARGTWRGADPPGGVAVPQSRLWLADPYAFEIVREIRQPPETPPE